MKKTIEAEGRELVLRNSYGDIIIVPKKDRELILGYLKKECHSCIDEYAQKLPTMKDYAQGGTQVPKEEESGGDGKKQQSKPKK